MANIIPNGRRREVLDEAQDDNRIAESQRAARMQSLENQLDEYFSQGGQGDQRSSLSGERDFVEDRPTQRIVNGIPLNINVDYSPINTEEDYVLANITNTPVDTSSSREKLRRLAIEEKEKEKNEIKESLNKKRNSIGSALDSLDID